MQLLVSQGDWGEGRPEIIEKLLWDTASHLHRLLRCPFQGTIHVQPESPTIAPMILFRASTAAPYIILLSARDRRWAQFAYQFSHEFCHVLSGYQRLEGNPNNWFHEAICELAAVFTLRRMAEQWSSQPPFPNWADYAAALRDYWQDRLSRQETQLSQGVTLRSWLSSNEQSLRNDRYQRQENALVAYVLLPIFESNPEGWNAIRNFPTSSGSVAEYLLDWYSSVDPEDKDFIARLADAFGYTIAT